MPMKKRFDAYLSRLCEVLGHADRDAPMREYCTGLMLPLKRKSVEPIAAHVGPQAVSAKHQSLLHFVGNSTWSDEAILRSVHDYVMQRVPKDGRKGWVLVVDDTGHPKQGRDSVGVARQYCGMLGKTDNCQVAVSVSKANALMSLPLAYRLYLPQEWVKDALRRKATKVPPEVGFATKPRIALEQLARVCEQGMAAGVQAVLADSAYGTEYAFRQGIAELGLRYAVEVKSTNKVWGPGQGPLPPAPWTGTGRVPTRWRKDPQQPAQSVKSLALALPASAWRVLRWREGTNEPLQSRFARVRVTVAHNADQHPPEQEWLLIEWPEQEKAPTKYWLSNLRKSITVTKLVGTVKMRWCIERDYQELKQEFGLSHYEGRGWRGFHHHATLTIAAYGFLVAERLIDPSSKKNAVLRKKPALPDGFRPRGAAAGGSPRARLDPNVTLGHRPRPRRAPASLPVLRETQSMTTHLLTQ
jgi:SRSO17 transposase